MFKYTCKTVNELSCLINIYRVFAIMTCLCALYMFTLFVTLCNRSDHRQLDRWEIYFYTYTYVFTCEAVVNASGNRLKSWKGLAERISGNSWVENGDHLLLLGRLVLVFHAWLPLSAVGSSCCVLTTADLWRLRSLRMPPQCSIASCVKFDWTVDKTLSVSCHFPYALRTTQSSCRPAVMSVYVTLCLRS